MNFLHLSFEDFFAYKLKFLSDIASPFNERLLARARAETLEISVINLHPGLRVRLNSEPEIWIL